MGNYVPVRCRHFSLMNRKDMSKCAGLYYLNADLLADDSGLWVSMIPLLEQNEAEMTE